MLNLFCTNDEKIKVTAAPVTSTGRPARIDGALRARVVSGGGAVMDVPGDPLSVYLVSGDDPGDTDYIIEADADLGEGVVLIQDSAVLHVSGAQAVALGLFAGSPEPK